MAWITPKTDWSAEPFNISDFNRIKNNLEYLHERASEAFGDFDIKDMGADLVSYSSYWNVGNFNAFEDNLDTINNHMIKKNYGFKQTFYVNAAFITATELNRIESAILDMNKTIIGFDNAKYSYSFRLGGLKGVKC